MSWDLPAAFVTEPSMLGPKARTPGEEHSPLDPPALYSRGRSGWTGVAPSLAQYYAFLRFRIQRLSSDLPPGSLLHLGQMICFKTKKSDR